jgi:hypothetical protein
MSGRDHGIDALRVLGIAGIVAGHWLVTALVLAPDGALVARSPLAGMGWLAPVTWLLQTLGLLFFVAGFAAGRSAHRAAGDRDLRGRASPTGVRDGGAAAIGAVAAWARRLRRLLRPAAGLVAVWAVALAAAAVAGAPEASLRTVAKLVVSPLWFVAVLVVLGALTAPVRWLVTRRHGPALVATAGVAVVATADAGLGYGPVTVLAAWLVPYALGVAAAAGRLRRPGTAWALLLTGAAAVPALVLLAGYPATAVGVPGAGGSNLSPPSLAAVALALGQVGAALLVRRRLRPPAPVVVLTRAVNRAGMGIYLWHQPALIVVTVLAARLAGGPVGGLHTPPDGPGWLGPRALWLPAFATALWVIVRVVDTPERADGYRPVRGPSQVYAVRRSRPGRVCADDHTEVIAVRDSDPPSRGRAARQLG